MNNEQVAQLIQGIGVMTELWLITYQSFKKQDLSDEIAVMHTKAFMSIMMDSFIGSGGSNGEEVK